LTSYIRAISYYLPVQVLTNEDLSALFPQYKPEGIHSKVGVYKRHIRGPGQTGSDLAYESAELFFREHGIEKREVDFLILCTGGNDYKGLTASCVLQNKLGLSQHCGAIDVPGGCTGFVYGLSVAKAMVESKQAMNVLLLTADVPSAILHPADHELRTIFGDAGAATMISAGKGESSIGQFVFGTDGSGAANLTVKHSGMKEPVTSEWLEINKDVGGMPHGRMIMKGEEIFIFALKVVPPMVKDLLDKEDMSMNDIDLFIFHQANGYLLEILRKKLKIEQEKFFVHMENCGNTISASIPIALKEAIASGKAKKGDKILLAGFGIGYSWAGTIITL
jgi:3-oxoacyl-[acyl-carrier-protein] synthase III